MLHYETLEKPTLELLNNLMADGKSFKWKKIETRLLQMVGSPEKVFPSPGLVSF